MISDFKVLNRKWISCLFLIAAAVGHYGCSSRDKKPGDQIAIRFHHHEGFADARPEFKKSPIEFFSSVRALYLKPSNGEEFRLYPGKEYPIGNASIKWLQNKSNYTLRCDSGKLGYLYISKSVFNGWNENFRTATVHLNDGGGITVEWK